MDISRAGAEYVRPSAFHRHPIAACFNCCIVPLRDPQGEVTFRCHNQTPLVLLHRDPIEPEDQPVRWTDAAREIAKGRMWESCCGPLSVRGPQATVS